MIETYHVVIWSLNPPMCNPYIHSSSVLCDIYSHTICFLMIGFHFHDSFPLVKNALHSCTNIVRVMSFQQLLFYILWNIIQKNVTCKWPPYICIHVGDGFLKTFFEKTKKMSPADRGKYLEEDEVTYIYSILYILMPEASTDKFLMTYQGCIQEFFWGGDVICTTHYCSF